MINHKRTERIYRQEGLALRIRRRKKMSSRLRIGVPKPDYPNHIWSMDFMRDDLANGRTIKVLSVVYEYTRKCFRIEVDTSINGVRVARVLSEIAQMEALPEVIVSDNGSQPISVGFMAARSVLEIRQIFASCNNPKGNADTERVIMYQDFSY